VAVTTLESRGHTHRNPVFLPDGKHFLFTKRAIAAVVGDLYVGSLDGGETKLVLPHASNAAYSQGYLLYLHDRNLIAQHFNPSTMAFSGSPVAVTEDVDYWAPKDLGNFSVSATGTLLYRKAQSSESRFAWVKLPGKETEEFGDTITGISDPVSVSTDSRKIAFAKREPNAPDTDLWLFDLDRKIMARQTFNVPGLIYSAFSPDGRKLAITASVGTKGSMKIRTLATGSEQPITSTIQDIAYVTSWSPDGKYLLVNVQDPKTLFDIYAQPADGSKPLPLLTQSYNERNGEVYPNGRIWPPGALRDRLPGRPFQNADHRPGSLLVYLESRWETAVLRKRRQGVRGRGSELRNYGAWQPRGDHYD
jgi:Tol biopolymer transport system component